MRVAGVSWALLSTPVAVLVVFVGLMLSAWTTYGLSDLSRPVPGTNGQARELLNPALRPWLATWRARWTRSRPKAIGSITSEVLYRLSVLAMAGFMGMLTAVIALTPVLVTLSLRGRSLPVWTGRSILLLGMVAGVASLIHVLRYSSRRSTTPKRFGPPVLSLPRGEIGAVRRVEFLRSVYLFTQLRSTTVVALVVGAIGPGIVSSDEETGLVHPPEPFGDIGGDPDQQGAYQLLWLGGIALGGAVAWLLARLIEMRMPAADAAVALHRCLNPDSGPRGSATRHAGIVDPFGRRRAPVGACHPRARRVGPSSGPRPPRSPHRLGVARTRTPPSRIRGAAGVVGPELPRRRAAGPA